MRHKGADLIRCLAGLLLLSRVNEGHEVNEVTEVCVSAIG